MCSTTLFGKWPKHSIWAVRESPPRDLQFCLYATSTCNAQKGVEVFLLHRLLKCVCGYPLEVVGCCVSPLLASTALVSLPHCPSHCTVIVLTPSQAVLKNPWTKERVSCCQTEFLRNSEWLRSHERFRRYVCQPTVSH